MKTYTDPSSARRAAKNKGLTAGQFTIETVEGGFQIVETPAPAEVDPTAGRVDELVADLTAAGSVEAASAGGPNVVDEFVADLNAAVTVEGAAANKRIAERAAKTTSKRADKVKTPKAPKAPKPPKTPKAPKTSDPAKPSSLDEILGMLRSAQGVTAAEIAAKFGWTVKASSGAVTWRLGKQKGYAITTEKDEKRGLVYRTAK